MERMKQQFEQIQQQMAALNASQKLLMLTLAGVAVATIAWWTTAAADKEMVPLLDQPLTAEQVGPIRDQLSRSGITYEVAGDNVMVAVADRGEALAMLTYERALPGDTTRHFNNALGNIGSFDPAKKIDATMVAATQDDLAQTIRRWPGVRGATVNINAVYKRQVGQDMMPSAVVNVETLGGANARKLADAAAHTVASAVSALEPQNVAVIVDGSRVESADASSPLAGGNKFLELRGRAEQHHEDNVRQALRYIPNLHVSVSVDVNDAVERATESKIDPKVKLVEVLSEGIENSDSMNGRVALPRAMVEVRATAPGMLATQ